MSGSSAASLDVSGLSNSGLSISRLSFDLRLCAEVVNGFTGCLEPDVIAAHVTNGLVDAFGCAFARVWLVEPDQQALRLVASSGLYTRLDGSFARVPMGCFKIGKIAQHCIPFLSNCLPEESWVKDREWAIANNIQGFAGLPLMEGSQAIGVLAVFSTKVMDPGFLEVLQMFSLAVTGALASALKHKAVLANVVQSRGLDDSIVDGALSESLAAMLGQQTLSLVGTEQTLPLVIRRLLVTLATRLKRFDCRYCRLVYEAEAVILETMMAVVEGRDQSFFVRAFSDLFEAAQVLGGDLSVQSDSDQTVVAIRLRLPQQGVNVDELLTAEPLLESAPKESVVLEPTDSPLSEREQQVMVLLTEGLRDRDIAEKLFISERTVKFHAKNILTKLDVRTRVQAVFEATRKGWLA
ncbi:MAG: LuxR C-terminal-related transcriptional regulator [Cyanobacteria bacterium J06650_10]